MHQYWGLSDDQLAADHLEQATVRRCRQERALAQPHREVYWLGNKPHHVTGGQERVNTVQHTQHGSQCSIADTQLAGLDCGHHREIGRPATASVCGELPAVHTTSDTCNERREMGAGRW